VGIDPFEVDRLIRSRRSRLHPRNSRIIWLALMLAQVNTFRRFLTSPMNHPCDARPLLPVASIEATSASALLGQVVGGLVVERYVAEGGIGVVYAARSRHGGPTRALKVLKPSLAGDSGHRESFAQEIAYARRVNHLNVVSVLDHGRLADGRPWLTMDLLEGATLGALVRREGPLPLARALAITDQVLAGLAALHAAGVVHQDLQPDNVFLARVPGSTIERAVLLDFGFARDTGSGARASLFGTPSFMSPEQALAGRAVTAQSDLFAAALLLSYALTGKPPFGGGGGLAARDVLVAIVRSAPVPVRRARRDVPMELDRILARALAKHPDARFSGAVEMRSALGRLACAA
jgi:serine/threonine protein kinase